jgi:hypothetical protein
MELEEKGVFDSRFLAWKQEDFNEEEAYELIEDLERFLDHTKRAVCCSKRRECAFC